MLCTRRNRRPQRRLAHCAHEQPPETASLLLPSERALTEPVAVHGWRYEPADVTYERKTMMLGGPLLFLLMGIISALRNRSARRSAEAEAAPRWRPLGTLTVLATTDRMLVWHQEAWWSVWYSAITQVTSDGEHLQLEFLESAPYLFTGDVLGLRGAIDKARCGAQPRGVPVSSLR